jgi:hypothetical protein
VHDLVQKDPVRETRSHHPAAVRPTTATHHTSKLCAVVVSIKRFC